MHTYCKKKVPDPGRAAGVGLVPAAGVRLGMRTPLACAISGWSQGVPMKLLEQGNGVSASRQMCQEWFRPPKAATVNIGLGLYSSNGVCMSLSVCLTDMCSASITVAPVMGKVAATALSLDRDSLPPTQAGGAPGLRLLVSAPCTSTRADPFRLLALRCCWDCSHRWVTVA